MLFKARADRKSAFFVTLFLLVLLIAAIVCALPMRGVDAEAAQSEEELKREFEINYSSRSGYVVSITADQESYPTFTLQYTKGYYSPADITFQFAVVSSLSDDLSDESLWHGALSAEDIENGGANPTYATTFYVYEIINTYGDEADQTGTRYEKYYFFRAVNENAEYVYQSPNWYEVVLDKSPSTDFAITGIDAYYYSGINRISYTSNLTSSNAVYISAPLYIEVTTNAGANAVLSYTLQGTFKTTEGVQPAGQTFMFETGSNIAIIGKEAGFLSFGSLANGGLITVHCQNSSGTASYSVNIHVYIDKEIPEFTVSATDQSGNTYNQNTWSKTAVNFNVTPSVSVASGATYYYRYTDAGSEWVSLQKSGERFVLQVLASASVQFKAVSVSGKVYESEIYKILIDTVAPVLVVSARDATGMTIVNTEGSGAGYRYRYAGNSITFTLTNVPAGGATQQSGNTIRYYYKAAADAEYTQINATGGNYTISFSGTAGSYVGSTYYFKLVSDSGYTLIKDFTFTILKSGYSVLMEMETFYPNTAGWLNSPVNVFFTVPDVLGTAGEYEIHGYKAGDTSTDQTLSAIVVTDSSTPAGMKKYKVQIGSNLNSEAMSFYLVDKAANRVETGGRRLSPTAELETNANLRTSILKLDLTVPSATVVSKIINSETVLTSTDWSTEAVVTTITPAILISGVSCYSVNSITNQRTAIPIVPVEGKFIIQKDVSGVYVYELVSGAGLTERITLTVNIDNSGIVLDSLSASTVDDNGDVIKSDILLDGSEKVAHNVLVNFNTNHAGHFEFYYLQYSGALSEINPANAILGAGDSFLIDISASGSAINTLHFAFFVRSLAESGSGDRSVSEIRTIVVSYDTRPFNIIVESNSTGVDWVGGIVTYTLSLDEQSIAGYTGIAVAKYQISYGASNVWHDISAPDDDLSDRFSYVFTGLKQYFNDAERDSDTEEDVAAYSSYNGTLSFRALNTAGHASGISTVDVKMDTSTPSPVYAISQTSGEIAYTGSYYAVTSKEAISLRQPTGALFGQKAPITFYYLLGSAEGTAPEIGDSAWNQLNGPVVLTASAYYWMYAVNAFSGQQTEIYKFYIYVESAAPSVTYVSGGTIESGIYQFPWSQGEPQIVKLRATSKTGVYFWYQLDGGAWTLLNPTAVAVNSSDIVEFRIVFLGLTTAQKNDPAQTNALILNYSDAYSAVVVGNLSATVRFRITNMAGHSVVVSESCKIRIDLTHPEFDLEFSNLERTLTEEDLVDWSPSTITVRVVDTGDNPSGVDYSYTVVGDGEVTYPLQGGKMISTNNINGKNGNIDENREITIAITARQNATGDATTKTITLRVDKIIPEFTLSGEAFNDSGVSKGSLSSGTWVNAASVIVSIAKKYPDASYTYQYYENGDTGAIKELNDATTMDFHDTTTFTVIAMNRAGISYLSTFQVNIDRVAPAINAGIIVNSADPLHPNKYYIDQSVYYIEANLKSAMYNNFKLSNGQIIATNTVQNTNGGLVEIVVEDMAGNKTTLTFYMCEFDLTVNTITLSEEHLDLLDVYEYQYLNARSTLNESRSSYFATSIARLKDRVSTLRKQINNYQEYLTKVNNRTAFDLVSDYEEMYTYINYFTTKDDLVRYPEWQQEMIKSGIYATYYDKLATKYAELESQMAIVRSVEKKVTILPATNVVTVNNYQDILRVYNAYEDLSTEQKAVFSPNLFTKLTELKRKCEVYLLQDETTGIVIYGDHLVGSTNSLRLIVDSVAKSSEKFNSAQVALLETVPKGGTRAIISISTLTLDGKGAQYDTGEIDITLPIPEAYQSYIAFAVYELSPNGSITPVKNVLINKDGRSVTFSTNYLSTYILATAANITVRVDADKVYGSIAGIEIDGTMLTYITYAVCAMFVLFVIVMAMIAIRRGKFLRSYNRDHKKALARRGISAIPKGNPPPISNPARPEERIDHERHVTYL